MNSLISKSFLLSLALLFSLRIDASPWIEVGDERLKSNLQLLNDSGAISIQLTSWPLMWADVKSELDDIDYSKLNSIQKSAVKELQFELAYQTKREVKRSIELDLASARPLLTQFSTFHREQAELHKVFDWDGQSMAVKLRTGVTSDPEGDSYEVNADGSYISGVLGDWVLGIGAIDRWWGPSQVNSLILSSNARPVPAILFRSKAANEFESPWLSWIGKWHFTSFVGQMESDRHIPETKLTGMRVTLKPTDRLEIGLSRLMQWGGEGRDEDLQTFFNSITSKGENTEEQSGNQQGGIDIRYTLPSWSAMSSSVYMQTVGEDEAGYLPSRRTYQFGWLAYYMLDDLGSLLSGFVDYTNTAADPFNDEFFNMTYEHSVYKSGLRYKGRALGSTYDNDAKVVSLGLSYLQSSGEMTSLVLSQAELNRDGVASGNSVSSSDVNIIRADLMHQMIAFNGRLKLGLSYNSDFVPTTQKDVDETMISASWEYRF